MTAYASCGPIIVWYIDIDIVILICASAEEAGGRQTVLRYMCLFLSKMEVVVLWFFNPILCLGEGGSVATLFFLSFCFFLVGLKDVWMQNFSYFGLLGCLEVVVIFFLDISSSWVKRSFHAEFQLPRLTGSWSFMLGDKNKNNNRKLGRIRGFLSPIQLKLMFGLWLRLTNKVEYQSAWTLVRYTCPLLPV